ncbi:MAG: S-layer homology domain-containing protein, partial [Clostridia bacterium]|nr:S-layer homology domain-containing protein [Clostridia bacterium]
MNKRLLSIFLSLCMVLTLLPFSAIAEENDTYDYSGGEITAFETPETTEQAFPMGTAVTTGSAMVAEITEPEAEDEIMLMVMDGVARIDSDSYYTLQSAIDAVQEGQTIQLLSNINLASTVTIAEDNNKSFSIDLNGKTLDGGSNSAITHRGTGVFTIKGSGRLQSNNSDVFSDGAINNQGSGSINVSGGTVQGNNKGISNKSTGTIIVSGGTVQGDDKGILNLSKGTVTVSSGDVSGRIAIFNNSAGFVNISGGTVQAIGDRGNAIYTNESGHLTISDDAVISSTNVNADDGTIRLWFSNQYYPITLTINGGTIENSSGGNAIIKSGNSSGVLEANITISDGKSALIRGGNGSLNFVPYPLRATVTASSNYDGSFPITYNPADISSYKYLMFEPSPVITGTASIDNTTPRIGDTLTASLVGGSNSGTLTYVWKAGGEQAGTGTSYTVTAADLGKTITLEITSSIETGKITSSDTAAVLKKSAPSAPGAPELSSKTHNSITLSANGAYEFSKDGITWQKGNIFSGLAANKAYTFYQRVAETDDTEESPASSSLSVTTDVAPANELTGTASIDNTTPRIGDTLTASLVGGSNSGTLTYIWKAGGEQAGTGTSYTATAADLGKTITLEITSSIETGKITSSATSAVLKKSAPSAPGAPALSSKTQNSVTLAANAAYEFSKDGITWQAGNVFSGLAANTAYTFYQRVAETSEREASAAGSGLTVTTNSITGGGGSSGGGGSTTPKPVAPAPIPQPPAAPVTPIFIEYPTISNMMVPTITPGVLGALNGFVVPESLVKGIDLPEALKTISVEGRIPNFADTGNHWAGDTINKAVERGLLNGVSEREFAPKSNLTLEQTLVG